MEAGRIKLNPRAENLRRLIESIFEMLAHRAHEKGIEITSFVYLRVSSLIAFSIPSDSSLGNFNFFKSFRASALINPILALHF